MKVEKKNIDKRINKERLIETFVELAEIPSPSGKEERIAKVLTNKLKYLGLKVEKDNYGNIPAFLEGEGEPILLCGHMDTVSKVRHKDIVVKINEEKGIIESDGTTILGADNKDSISAILEMLFVLKENNFTHQPLEIIFTRQEEDISKGAKKLVKDPIFKKLKSKKCIISDLSGDWGRIATVWPCCYKFDIKIIGKSVHAKNPEKGINAITIASELIQRIPQGKIGKNISVNTAYIMGGDHEVLQKKGEITKADDIWTKGRNSVPDLCLITGEVRGIDQKKAKKICCQIKKICAHLETEKKYFGCKIKPEIKKLADKFEVDKNELVVKEVVEIFSQQEKETQFIIARGGSDANVFNDQGIKTALISSAHKNSHELNEYLIIENLYLLTDFFVKLVTNQEDGNETEKSY